jgi:hypothetical protein
MRPTVVAVSTCLLFAACSGGDDASDATTADSLESSESAGEVPVGSSGDTAGSAAAPPAVGDVDCALLTDTAAADGLVGLQLIPQITAVDVAEDFRTGDLAIAYDLDKLDAYLQALLPLADLDTEVFGTPRASIERYIAAAAQARVIAESPTPVTQEMVDALAAEVGETSDFIGGQASVSMAIDIACNGG